MDPFQQKKKSFMERLAREAEMGRVDFDLIDVLNGINSLPNYYTTSSCSGRIMIAKAERLGFAKSNNLFSFVAKWHRPITVNEVSSILMGLSNAWLMVRSAIFHVVARSMEDAELLLRLARMAGFKHSGISTVRDWGYLVELLGEDRLDVPLKIHDVNVFSDLDPIVDAANEVLIFAKLRLVDLIRLIERELMNADYPLIRISKVPYRAFKSSIKLNQ
ncbi:MAG: hypothetical protein RXO22_04015 [Thermocladium sp.]